MPSLPRLGIVLFYSRYTVNRCNPVTCPGVEARNRIIFISKYVLTKCITWFIMQLVANAASNVKEENDDKHTEPDARAKNQHAVGLLSQRRTQHAHC